MRFEGPVLLYGAGREGRSTLQFLKANAPGLEILVTADSDGADLPGTRMLPPADVPGAMEAGRFAAIVKSPGVSLYGPIIAAAVRAGIEITSNLNLWGEHYRAGRTVIAVTGTKGKSTTASLLHQMLVQSGLDAGLAGNFGVAPLDIADRHGIVVFELSSYQTADLAFGPDIAGITNLYPEHTDWHGSAQVYFRDKLRLVQLGDFPVALGAGARDNPLVVGAVGSPSRLIPALDEDSEAVLTKAAGASRLRGAHNLDNARLAARLALSAGASTGGIEAAVGAFVPLPHRLEEHTHNGTIFVDNSISTTPEATKAALGAYKGVRIALIAGGHERQQDYTELASLLTVSGVTTLVCLPVTGTRLAAEARRLAPVVDVLSSQTLEEAIRALSARRHAFDAVILSPGAPSYGQMERPGVAFRNFEERGAAFVSLARRFFA